MLSCLARQKCDGEPTKEAFAKPMTDKKHDDAVVRPARRRRGWKHIHHSPLFWVGFFLFLAAIAIYLWSDDLSWHPRLQ